MGKLPTAPHFPTVVIGGYRYRTYCGAIARGWGWGWGLALRTYVANTKPRVLVMYGSQQLLTSSPCLSTRSHARRFKSSAPFRGSSSLHLPPRIRTFALSRQARQRIGPMFHLDSLFVSSRYPTQAYQSHYQAVHQLSQRRCCGQTGAPRGCFPIWPNPQLRERPS